MSAGDVVAAGKEEDTEAKADATGEPPKPEESGAAAPAEGAEAEDKETAIPLEHKEEVNALWTALFHHDSPKPLDSDEAIEHYLRGKRVLTEMRR